MNRMVAMVALSLVALSACAPSSEVGGALASQSWRDATDLDDSERGEVRQSVDDALCYCLAALGTSIPTPESAEGELSDLELREAYMRIGSSCSGLSSSSVRGSRPSVAQMLGGPDPAQRERVNACADATPSETGGNGLVSSLRGAAYRGLCRAELNYCWGQELRLEAESLARAPSSPAVRDWLHATARERFTAAAAEYASSLVTTGSACGTSSWSRDGRGAECTRLANYPEFGRLMTLRMSDAVSQMVELTELETQSLMARGDALARTSARGDADYVTQIWGVDDEGRTGFRLAAAERLYGGLDFGATAASFRATSAVATSDLRGRSDFPHSERVQSDQRAARLLGLMNRYAVPSAHFTATGTSPYSIPMVYDGFEGIEDVLFNLLDHRMAAASFVGPYGVPADATTHPDTWPGAALRRRMPVSFEEAEQLSPLAADASPLRELGYTPSDVPAAVELAYDMLTTMDVDAVFHRQIVSGSGSTVLSLDAMEVRAVRQRDPLLAMSALMMYGPYTDGRSDPLGVPHPGIPVEYQGVPLLYAQPYGTPRERNFYALDSAGASGQSAAAAAQIVRVHLLRLLDGVAGVPGGTSDPRRFADTAVVQQAVRVLDQALGPVWTEVNRDTRPRDCGSTVCLPTDDLWDGPSYAQYDIYYDPNDPEGARVANGRPVLVRTLDHVHCLVRGEDGCATPTELSTEVVAPAIGRSRRRFFLPQAAEFADPEADPVRARAFVLWATSTGESTRYALFDIVHPYRWNEVHPLGGQFARRLGEILSRDPVNPARPAISSHGLPYDYVPPLESELTDDGDGSEDSWQTYLREAEQAAQRAAALVTEARDAEIEMLQDRTAGAISDEAAAIAHRQVVGEICGARASGEDCSVPRSEPVTLGELGLVPDPVIPPERMGMDGQPLGPVDRAGTRRACRSVDVQFMTENFALPTEDGHNRWAAYVGDYLGSNLTCAYWNLLSAARRVAVTDLPVRVRMELETDGPGDFADVDGAARAEMVALYGNLLAIRDELQNFHTTYQVALAAAINAGLGVAAELASGDEGWCNFGKAFAAVISVVAAVVVSVVSWGSGAVAAISSAAVAVTYSASTWNECSEHYRRAEQRAESGFLEASAAMGELERYVGTARTAVLAVARSDARLDSLERSADIADARLDLALRASAASSSSDLPEWSALQDVRVRRAREAVARAQRAAWIARRAIELRLVEDLGTQFTPERFVPSPGSWVNDVWILDRATAGSTPRGTYVSASAEALEDYVQRLDDYVRGYSFSHRFAEGTDTAVFDVAALQSLGNARPTEETLAERLRYQCPGRAEPLPMMNGELPCARPDWAEISFFVSPNRGGYVSDRIADGNYNYRHDWLALNVDGTSVIDCARADRVSECRYDDQLPFELIHHADSMLESYDRTSRLFELGPAAIRGGRMLSDERAIELPIASADADALSRVARTELRGRPIDGAYTLRIYGRPEIVWDHIRGVQLVLGYQYWTRQ